MRIGEVARRSGFSPDTLRYYDKIGLMPRIVRGAGGRREYGEADLERLAFIQRAKSVDFSLDDIRALLRLRSAPHGARPEVLHLTHAKLTEIERKLTDLTQLRSELTRLTDRCQSVSGGACPILDELGADRAARRSHGGNECGACTPATGDTLPAS